MCLAFVIAIPIRLLIPFYVFQIFVYSLLIEFLMPHDVSSSLTLNKIRQIVAAFFTWKNILISKCAI